MRITWRGCRSFAGTLASIVEPVDAIQMESAKGVEEEVTY